MRRKKVKANGIIYCHALYDNPAKSQQQKKIYSKKNTAFLLLVLL